MAGQHGGVPDPANQPAHLQTLRDNGTLAYSQIVRKMFYRAEDVRRIVPLVEERRTLAALKGKTI